MRGATRVRSWLGFVEEGADVFEEDCVLERFGEEIVGAVLEGFLAGGGFVEAGEDEDGDSAAVGGTTEMGAEIKAVEAGHHEVHNEEVGLVFLEAVDGLDAVASLGDAVMLFFEDGFIDV